MRVKSCFILKELGVYLLPQKNIPELSGPFPILNVFVFFPPEQELLHYSFTAVNFSTFEIRYTGHLRVTVAGSFLDFLSMLTSSLETKPE
jgi:hypothetical protein